MQAYKFLLLLKSNKSNFNWYLDYLHAASHYKPLYKNAVINTADNRQFKPLSAACYIGSH